jgi:hypothetical protein
MISQYAPLPLIIRHAEGADRLARSLITSYVSSVMPSESIIGAASVRSSSWIRYGE